MNQMQISENNVVLATGHEVRAQVRRGTFRDQTAGQAPNYLQGNVVILHEKDAADFLEFCQKNPKPCPIIGLSQVGDPKIRSLGNDLDIRFDVPKYRVFNDGVAVDERTEISDLWSDDLVTFVIGCSFSFEEALIREGFGVRHIECGQNVPMFKTNIKTSPVGDFAGPLVVSMRPYKAEHIPSIVTLCEKFPHAHGAPVFWGEPSEIGINSIFKPDYGEPVVLHDDEVPVFWACGVTPQAVVEAAQLDFCITHAPGHMLVTDLQSDQTIDISTAVSTLTNQLNS